jgi:two-component system response regulator MtrA
VNPLATSHPSRENSPLPGCSSRGVSVFVVDDERLIAEVVGSILTLEGFATQTFTNPATALEAFLGLAKKPDVLVTDFVMQPLNGMELIQRCRKVHPELLTLLYSGNVSGDVMDLYFEKPHSFLEKPFHPKKLVRIVRALVEHRQVNAESRGYGLDA